MPNTSKLRYLRIAPRKTRMVADLVRGKTAKEARSILSFTTKKGAKPILKLLDQALANAKNNSDTDKIDEINFYISEIRVDEGPKYKRWMPRARGSASEIQKKTSHVVLTLDIIEKPVKVKKAGAEKKEAEKTAKKPLVDEKEEKDKAKPEFKKSAKEALKFSSKSKKPQSGDKGGKKIFRRKSF